MKTLLLTSLCFFFSCGLKAQTPFAKNDIYLEAGGNGLFGSVNYERRLTKEPRLGIRFGVGFYSENGFYLTLPVGINYLFPLKNKRSFIEGGLGVTWTTIDGELFNANKDPNGEKWINFVPSIGYRRHTKSDVMWRANISPIINKYGGVPWLGFSIGKRF